VRAATRSMPWTTNLAGDTLWRMQEFNVRGLVGVAVPTVNEVAEKHGFRFAFRGPPIAQRGVFKFDDETDLERRKTALLGELATFGIKLEEDGGS
jgi:hypothetical protein